ncbi:MAG: DUF368 domain-containing protein [Rhodobacterales bacterium]|nr:DUF368 domain-containing protein [Rhodobacterales bacterium]
MGLANLVPGISGGTMLLAAGVYPDFIDGIAEITRLKFHKRSLVTLACVGGAAGLAILLLAGPVKDLVVYYRWAMYSLFIGLTLGGTPIVKGLLGDMDRNAKVGAAAGFLGMSALALLQAMGAQGGVDGSGPFALFLAGVVAAGAMILPGLSGGYLLLVLGAYVPILSGIHGLKEALKNRDLVALVDPLTTVVIPVGIGVAVGIVVVSNVLKWLLDRHRSSTLGVLLGLLVGAVVGLYPFQAGVRPVVGDIVKGQVLTEASLVELDLEDWPAQVFTPTPGHMGGSGGLILLGLGITVGIRKLGGDKE